jgi:hypothetical protein
VNAPLSLMDFSAVRRYWHVRRTAMIVSLAATAGILATPGTGLCQRRPTGPR